MAVTIKIVTSNSHNCINPNLIAFFPKRRCVNEVPLFIVYGFSIPTCIYTLFQVMVTWIIFSYVVLRSVFSHSMVRSVIYPELISEMWDAATGFIFLGIWQSLTSFPHGIPVVFNWRSVDGFCVGVFAGSLFCPICLFVHSSLWCIYCRVYWGGVMKHSLMMSVIRLLSDHGGNSPSLPSVKFRISSYLQGNLLKFWLNMNWSHRLIMSELTSKQYWFFLPKYGLFSIYLRVLFLYLLFFSIKVFSVFWYINTKVRVFILSSISWNILFYHSKIWTHSQSKSKRHKSGQVLLGFIKVEGYRRGLGSR